MSNKDTLQSINTNIETILTSTIGWKLEDLSDKVSTIKDTPLTTLRFIDLNFEDIYGQKPKYLIAAYEIYVFGIKFTPAEIRDKQAEFAFEIRDNITVDALNVGALATTKYVSRITHRQAENEYSPPQTRLVYPLAVRFREI